MTSRRTSELGYYVRGQAAALGGNKALDVAAVRYGVINNLDHLQDEMTQHGGNLVVPNTSGFLSYWTQATTTPGTVSRFDRMPPTFQPLRMQSDGSSSRVQITARVRVTAGTGTFRFGLRYPRFGALSTAPFVATTTTHVADFATSSATVVTTRQTLYVSRLTDSWLLAGMPSTDGEGAASIVGFYACLAEVWGTSTSGHPIVEAFTVREYVGG